MIYHIPNTRKIRCYVKAQHKTQYLKQPQNDAGDQPGSIKVISQDYFLRCVDPDMKYESTKDKAREYHFRKPVSEIPALYSQVQNTQQLQKSFSFPQYISLNKDQESWPHLSAQNR